MSFAFYIQELNGNETNKKIYECLNDAITNKKTDDVSLFVNNVNFCNFETKFGVFNSTELWNYTGLLITNTVNNAIFANKVVNKFKHVFYAEDIEKNIMGLIAAVNALPCFVSSESRQKEIKRLTGKTLPVLELNAVKILEEFNK